MEHSDKPVDIDQYVEWLKKNHAVEIAANYEAYYDSIAHKILRDFENSQFWQELLVKWDEYKRQYHIENKYQLYSRDTCPSLIVKPYDSFLLKTFRKNVLNNNLWPNCPVNGWVLPDNWFGKVNDTVRSTIVARYLDGVEFLVEKLSELAEQFGLESSVDYEAKDEGYYAAHFYILFDCDLPTETWMTRREKVQIEIQITTQLQEVIKVLLHKYYEDKRKRSSPQSIKWQWDYTSDEFSTNYLGHILHYVEGMIMEVRDKQDRGNK